MISVVQFCPQYANEVSLLLQQKKIWKENSLTEKQIDFLIQKYSADDKLNILYLATYQGRVIAMLGCKKWSSLPYYTILDYRSTLSAHQVSLFKQTNRLLWEKLITDREQENFHSFYWSIRNYPLATKSIEQGALQLQKFVPLLLRYQFNVEAIVERGSRSNYSLYNTFIGDGEYSSQVVIKRATMKPEFFIQRHLASQNLSSIKNLNM